MTLYDVLELEATASAEDVRRAYRKLALKWHPDKQIQENGDENDAVGKFREIQNAYEILTDERERNSYDARLRRLQKKNGSTNQTCAPPETFTEVADLLFEREYMEFPANVQAYGDVFLKIAGLETTDYPDFFLNGNEPIQVFYAEWGSFATSLDFEWVQQPIDPRLDRRIRRAIEQENVKKRKVARKEYNEQVRIFVEFVRKRDHRYKAYQSMQLEKKRQEEEHAAAAAAAAAELKMQRREMNLNVSISDDDQESEEDIFEQQLWHCPACEKYFKSEGAFANHEKSKKHVKNVKILRQVLLLEEEDDAFTDFENLTISQELDAEAKDVDNREQDGPSLPDPPAASDGNDDGDDDGDGNGDGNGDARQKESPVGEQRRRRRRRALTKEGKKKEPQSSSLLSCATCKESFPSRNQLFKHIKKEGHASFKALK